jgi:hypothetical protein
LLSYLPTSLQTRKWCSIAITLILSGLLTLWAIYGLGDYGVALFVLIPIFMGFSTSILYGYKNPIKFSEARNSSFITIGIFSLLLLLFAIEGLICIIMVAPLALPLTALGSFIGFALVEKAPKPSGTALLLFLAVIPSMAFIEKDTTPEVTSVVTSIVIKASPETVWKNVVEFPELEKPTELLFKTGIAYPINAKIEGAGVGAVRHCNFTTGSFVEPVTVWDAPRLLAFDVLEQPAPMKEISFWDLDAPHLHDYFVSKKGQFKLTRLSNGDTRLEGTTWYYHNIKPAMYWRPWSNYIIHQIHNRVLSHIKKISEKK